MISIKHFVVQVVVFSYLTGNYTCAQEFSRDEVLCKLDPNCAKPKMRSLRGITVMGDPVIDSPNSATFHINFEYDSATLTTDALITLDRVAAVLKDPKLVSYEFTIAGHTDGKGTAEYNQSLSQRRANSVKEYLVKKHQVSSDHLKAQGFGKAYLLDKQDPENAINRRVQLVNNSKP